MEANGARTLPEITSSPLKIKCCTHILILLPRLSIYVSNHTKVKLQSGVRRLNSEQRLVWKATRHIRLYSADFVICSNPPRVQNERRYVLMLYLPANIFTPDLRIGERNGRNRKINLAHVLFCSVQDLRKCWKRKFTRGQIWSERSSLETKSKQCDNGGSKARGWGLLSTFFVTGAWLIELRGGFIVWHFIHAIKLLIWLLYLLSH